MPLKSLRQFINALEQSGELLRVKEPVHWRYEIGCWTRYSYDMRPRGPGLLFENIKGYESCYQVFTNGIGTYRRLAMALGLPLETPVPELIEIYAKRIANPIPPKVVDDGPVRENILTGEEVDLYKFPVPWWTPKDGGRYIGTWDAVVSRNAESGVTNLGTYRFQVLDKNHACAGFKPGTHIALHYIQREQKDEALEAAIVIGAPEVAVMAASTGVPEWVDEYAIAGGLGGEPVELVKCETVDLYVPATAEIVLEGRILPHVRRPEGPFAEFTGYYGGGIRMTPVFEVTAITHRDDPILRGVLFGKPIDEGHIVGSIKASAAALSLFRIAGPPGVKAIYCPPDGAPDLWAIIQMKPHYVGHSREVGRFWASIGRAGGKYAIIVDEDIDPFNLSEVWWAITTRTKAGRDFEVLPFGPMSRADPSIPGELEYTDYLIIDATKKLDYPYTKAYGGHWAPVAVPPEKVMELVGHKWKRLVEGKADEDKHISALEQEIDQLEKEWAEFREKAYQLTPEEQEREITRSHPKVSK